MYVRVNNHQASGAPASHSRVLAKAPANPTGYVLSGTTADAGGDPFPWAIAIGCAAAFVLFTRGIPGMRQNPSSALVPLPRGGDGAVPSVMINCAPQQTQVCGGGELPSTARASRSRPRRPQPPLMSKRQVARLERELRAERRGSARARKIEEKLRAAAIVGRVRRPARPKPATLRPRPPVEAELEMLQEVAPPARTRKLASAAKRKQVAAQLRFWTGE